MWKEIINASDINVKSFHILLNKVLNGVRHNISFLVQTGDEWYPMAFIETKLISKGGEEAPGMGFEPMRTRRSTGLLAKNACASLCLKARALTTLPSRH